MLNTSLTPELYTLYQALKAMPFDTRDVEFTFAKRLAAENAWSQTYADRVIEEYLRFLLLTQAADFTISPSDAVDQAWHLHMLYSRSYWDILCAQVLKKPLHHDPVDGGGQDRDLFISQYTRTLELYASVLGETPPKDIWPTAEQRFAAKVRFQRINTLHWEGGRVFKPSEKWLLAGIFSLPAVMLGGIFGGILAFIGLIIFTSILGNNLYASDGSINNNNNSGSGGGCGGGGGDGGGCGGGCGGCGGG